MTDIGTDAIDGRFVPEARSDVASVVVGGEMVLGRIAAGTSYLQTCALNESGAIVWQCFDGSGTIDEIAADIADVFAADIESVRADVEGLAREVGGAGLLVGVQAQVIEIDDGPPSTAVGASLPAFDATEDDGAPFVSEQLRGRRALIVSWSPTCAFCALIAGDLAELQPRLGAAGVELVVLGYGDARANRESLDRGGLGARLLLARDGATDPFAGMGTPVAYLVDEQGCVAEPVALGSTDVLALARRIVAGAAPA